jgi:hypothetical protein
MLNKGWVEADKIDKTKNYTALLKLLEVLYHYKEKL